VSDLQVILVSGCFVLSVGIAVVSFLMYRKEIKMGRGFAVIGWLFAALMGLAAVFLAARKKPQPSTPKGSGELPPEPTVEGEAEKVISEGVEEEIRKIEEVESDPDELRRLKELTER
jgi:hypothetical protein